MEGRPVVGYTYHAQIHMPGALCLSVTVISLFSNMAASLLEPACMLPGAAARFGLFDIFNCSAAKCVKVGNYLNIHYMDNACGSFKGVIVCETGF
jgi:hypothetical protein